MSTVNHDVPTLAPPRVEEVGEDVFAYIQPDGGWWINNTGFLVGGRGVISVDACSTVRRTRAYLDAIATVTPQPVRTLINTHHHGDHTFGNHLFDRATIVGHEATRAGVLAWGEPKSAPYWTDVDWGDVVVEPPFLTYTDSVTVWADELRADVRHVGLPAHTTNDSIVWLPERKVLFSGDLLFNGGTPFLVQGSVAGAIRVLEEVVAPLGATTIVPGHGAVSGPGLVDDVLGYLRFVQKAARDGRAAGLTPLETARELDLGQYAGLLDSERIVGNLYRAYAELEGGPLGRPVDVGAALTDMVAFNGGRPLTCLA
ncbi:MBL fold metallo-hydrolase [Streptomyces lucensis JCM 4490]|uniref:MBL fold metallo-hydrolase n=1 Tax=Streptomyces lucensis JCM 4490 TaxID=1306176 RepID=A0A918MJH4_9ACTN|nr:MBL fold metallo-hydrolase [Streptomyces lucensis]GGW32031.1 MBL fold metallo-hydrolase [Streptomyces lucensis JCM 4490]